MRNVLAVVGVLALLVIAGASVLSYVEERNQTEISERAECVLRAATTHVAPSGSDDEFKFGGDSLWWEENGGGREVVDMLASLVASSGVQEREAERCG